jgi:hypothetical protein
VVSVGAITMQHTFVGRMMRKCRCAIWRETANGRFAILKTFFY